MDFVFRLMLSEASTGVVNGFAYEKRQMHASHRNSPLTNTRSKALTKWTSAPLLDRFRLPSNVFADLCTAVGSNIPGTLPSLAQNIIQPGDIATILHDYGTRPLTETGKTPLLRGKPFFPKSHMGGVIASAISVLLRLLPFNDKSPAVQIKFITEALVEVQRATRVSFLPWTDPGATGINVHAYWNHWAKLNPPLPKSHAHKKRRPNPITDDEEDAPEIILVSSDNDSDVMGQTPGASGSHSHAQRPVVNVNAAGYFNPSELALIHLPLLLATTLPPIEIGEMPNGKTKYLKECHDFAVRVYSLDDPVCLLATAAAWIVNKMGEHSLVGPERLPRSNPPKWGAIPSNSRLMTGTSSAKFADHLLYYICMMKADSPYRTEKEVKTGNGFPRNLREKFGMSGFSPSFDPRLAITDHHHCLPTYNIVIFHFIDILSSSARAFSRADGENGSSTVCDCWMLVEGPCWHRL